MLNLQLLNSHLTTGVKQSNELYIKVSKETSCRFDSVFEMFPTVRDALAAMSPDALAAYDASGT